MPEVTEPDHLRLFVALAIPEPVKDELEKAQGELRRLLPQGTVRWTRREQFHLTLRFLGNVEAQSLATLSQALNLAARVFAPLQLQARQVGFFPNARFPRVLWVGVRCDPQIAAGREIARGDRVTGMAASQAETVHQGVVYDIEVDTSHTEPMGCARAIASRVA